VVSRPNNRRWPRLAGGRVKCCCRGASRRGYPRAVEPTRGGRAGRAKQKNCLEPGRRMHVCVCVCVCVCVSVCVCLRLDLRVSQRAMKGLRMWQTWNPDSSHFYSLTQVIQWKVGGATEDSLLISPPLLSWNWLQPKKVPELIHCSIDQSIPPLQPIPLSCQLSAISPQVSTTAGKGNISHTHTHTHTQLCSRACIYITDVNKPWTSTSAHAPSAAVTTIPLSFRVNFGFFCSSRSAINLAGHRPPVADTGKSPLTRISMCRSKAADENK